MWKLQFTVGMFIPVSFIVMVEEDGGVAIEGTGQKRNG